MEIKPITPEELDKDIVSYHPSMIEVFNELIRKNYNGHCAKVLQADARDLFLAKEPMFSSSEMFERKYMDIEVYYREVGWHVEYKKPSHNDSSFVAYFIFTPKK